MHRYGHFAAATANCFGQTLTPWQQMLAAYLLVTSAPISSWGKALETRRRSLRWTPRPANSSGRTLGPSHMGRNIWTRQPSSLAWCMPRVGRPRRRGHQRSPRMKRQADLPVKICGHDPREQGCHLHAGARGRHGAAPHGWKHPLGGALLCARRCSCLSL